MAEQTGLHKIKILQQRLIVYQFAVDVLWAFAGALLLSCMLHSVTGLSFWWSLPVFLVVFTTLTALRKPWRISQKSISVFLNRSYPELEESADLLIKPMAELNLLEKLQLTKIEIVLQQDVPEYPKQFIKPLKIAGAAVLAALMLGFLSVRIPYHIKSTDQHINLDHSAGRIVKETILPQINGVMVAIMPPTYTGKARREQDRFTIDAEEGSVVSWKINTNIAIKQMTLVFNEQERIKMRSAGNGKQWITSKQLNKQGFYQVDIDGKLSDIYSLQIIKDEPPVIHIKAPKQYTYIDAGEALAVNIDALVNDDYGISNAIINATVAKGSGEAVKFKEYKIPFSASFNSHNTQYDLRKFISLSALNMEPGDELYFYIQAQDTHQQASRTDVYIVSIQDTAKLLSMDGLLSGVNVKPEFFRSQRQIIIDSQKLLAEKDSISAEAFKSRSNDLGADQKMLRLRYGRFLGEEEESKIGEAEGGELSKAENFGNTQKILDAYTDKHDNEEDATFIDPSEKAQLRATLAEMWKAELHLRMYKPQDALPFEYKALRLLKDLQQKSRAYVAKTGYNTPPLKMEKRLSGDLSKITPSVSQLDIKGPVDQYVDLKSALIVLDQLKIGSALNSNTRRTLQLARQQLSSMATARPGMYLPAINALNHIIAANDKLNRADILAVQKAIQETLPRAKATPQAATTTVDMGLEQEYFKMLNRSNK